MRGFTTRDRHAVAADRIIAAKKQSRRNAVEWARRAAGNLRAGDTVVAVAQFTKAADEMVRAA